MKRCSSSSTPSVRAAISVLLNSSHMICRSTAVPAQVHAACPSSVRKLFSGEVDGEVTSLPFSSGRSISRHASAAPFMTG